MQYQKTSFGYTVVLAKGELVMETLTAFAATEKIAHAWLSGLGAVEHTECCAYDLATKEYVCCTFEDTHEVLALTGNITIVDGKPFIHAHVTLGSMEMRACGGHLKEAIVGVTLEIAVHTSTNVLSRVHDAAIGLNLITV